MSDSPPSKPRRGAPLGNKNRFRHGLYSHQPPSTPQTELPANHLTLSQEISYLRAYIHRTAMLGSLTVELDLTVEVLHALSLAATALTRLVQTENWLSQETGTHVQIDELPRALARMDLVSNKVTDYLAHRSVSSPASKIPEIESGSTPSMDQDDSLVDLPAPAPKLPAGSGDIASDPDVLARLDRLTRQ